MDTLFLTTTQTTMPFPQSLTIAYQPKTLSEFCGLEKQRKILANLAQNPRAGITLLLEGATGTGKTSIAFAFARTIGAEVHHIGSQEANLENLRATVAMCNYVPLNGGFHLVLIDEIDKSSSAFQLACLSLWDGSKPVPSTIFVCTANDTSNLEARFLNRCLRLPAFNTYKASESIKALLSRVWRERAAGAPEPDFSRVPTGSVREALNWLEVELLSV